MKLVICEKPSVAKSIASALGVTSRADGCFEGNGLIVSWCVGHLVSPMDAAGYDPGYKKWRYDDLPILPEPFRYVLVKDKEDAFQNLKRLMERPDVTERLVAGAVLFRLVFDVTLPSYSPSTNTTIQRLENGQKYISARLSSDKAAILI